MANKVKQTNTSVNKKKRKFRLKKSARRTIASLSIASAVIVAAIPVGRVSAEGDSTFPAPGSSVPTLDVVLENYKYCNDSLVKDLKIDIKETYTSETTGWFWGKNNDNIDREVYQDDISDEFTIVASIEDYSDLPSSDDLLTDVTDLIVDDGVSDNEIDDVNGSSDPEINDDNTVSPDDETGTDDETTDDPLNDETDDINDPDEPVLDESVSDNDLDSVSDNDITLEGTEFEEELEVTGGPFDPTSIIIADRDKSEVTPGYAFPIKQDAFGDPVSRVISNSNGTYTYYLMDTDRESSGMVPYKNNPVPLYEMAKVDADYDCVVNYLGDNNAYEFNSNVVLGNCVGHMEPDEILHDPYIVWEGDIPFLYTEIMRVTDDRMENVNCYIQVCKRRIKFDLYDDETPEERNLRKQSITVTSDLDEVNIFENENFYAFSTFYEIKYINDKAFGGKMTNVSSIQIPRGVRKIGKEAFKDCNGLSEIILDANLQSLGVEAFSGCSRLSTITIKDPSSLMYIGDGAFAYTGISSVVLPASVKTIGSGAFYGCSNLDDSIDENNCMFRNHTGVEKIDLGSFVFANCKSLRNIKLYKNIQTIGNGVDPKTTGEGTFAGCTNLEHVWLPEYFGMSGGQTVFAPGTFYMAGTNSLKWVRVGNRNDGHNATFTDGMFITPDHSSDTLDATVPQEFAIWGPTPSSTTEAYKYAKRNSNTYMWEEPEGVMNYELTDRGYKFIFNQYGEITGVKVDKDYLDNYVGTDKEKDMSPTLRIPNNIGGIDITKINNKALYGFTSVENHIDKVKCPEKIVIPENINRIGESAFEMCATDSLKEVEINTNGVEIQDNAFAANPIMKNVCFTQVVAGGETSIGDKCFYNCPQLETIEFRNDSYDGDNYNDVNIVSVGTDAFKTMRPAGKSFTYAPYGETLAENCWLVIKGDFYAEDNSSPYMPYEFSTQDNRVSNVNNSYITYTSGNPQNIVTRYDTTLNDGAGGVSVIKYPTLETLIGYDSDSKPISIHDLAKRREAGGDMLQNEIDIVNSCQSILVPHLVDCIDKAGNNLAGKDNEYFNFINDPEGCGHGTKAVTFVNVKQLPDNGPLNSVDELLDYEGTFSYNETLRTVTFQDDVKDLGTLPFFKSPNLENVLFWGDATSEEASPENPKFWCTNGIVYSDDGTNVYIEEVLTGRGYTFGSALIDANNDEDISRVTAIRPGAFNNCKNISEVDLKSATKLKTIPDYCFSGCNLLGQVTLPPSIKNIKNYAFMDMKRLPDNSNYDLNNGQDSSIDHIKVYVYGSEVGLSDNAFDYDAYPTVISYPNSAILEEVEGDIKPHALEHHIIQISTQTLGREYTVTFYDDVRKPSGTGPAPWNGTSITVPSGGSVIQEKYPEPIEDIPGYTYEWVCSGDLKNVTRDLDVVLKYIPAGTSSSTGSSGSSSSGSTSTTSKSSSSKKSSSGGGGGGGSTQQPSKSSSSSASSSSQSTGSTAGSPASATINSSTIPVLINGANSGYPIMNAGDPGSVGTPGTVENGRTTVISTTPGMTDVGKMSATVNGSSDNYVIKICETQEANECAVQALTNEFGSLEAIRYLPIDISLYDSTGTNLISPVPDGVTVSITVPIPDDLVIYGGNAKAASTKGGVLEKMSPRFTMINSVPCMTFTASHFSPYVIYVDTANLSDPGILDSTPKTGDMIHPKWFLAIGLAAVGIFLFLKRDQEDKAKMKAA